MVDDLRQHVERAGEERAGGRRLVLVAHALGPGQPGGVPEGPAEHLVPREHVAEDLGPVLDPRAAQGPVEPAHPRRLDQLVALPAHDRAGGEVGARVARARPPGRRTPSAGARRRSRGRRGSRRAPAAVPTLRAAPRPPLTEWTTVIRGVAVRPLVGDLAGAVGRAVVDDDGLPAAVRLGEQRADAVVEVVLHAPRGDRPRRGGEPRENERMADDPSRADRGPAAGRLPAVTEQARAIDEMNPDGVPRKVLFVAGAGRSGTSTLAGIVSRLGMHVPLPEVPPDDSNPRGFSEPQWVVDVHDEWLAEALVQVSDSRPNAWFETGRICSREPARIRVSEWLEPHFDQHPELVVKDPRLSWFLGLWRVAAIRTGATPGLRHDAAPAGRGRRLASRSTTPTSSAPPTSPPAGSTCCSTPSAPPARRGATAAGVLRALRGPAHRLGEDDDGARPLPRPPDDHPHPQRPDPRGPPLHRPAPAPGHLDPRRPRPAEAAARPHRRRRGRSSTSSPTRAATPPRRTRRSTSCARRTSTSTRRPRRSAARPPSTPASRRRRRALAEGAGAEPRSLADRMPHDVRAAIPPSVRRGVRKALGRDARAGTSSDRPDRLGPRPHQPRGPRATSTSSGPGTSPAACAAAPPRCCGSRTRRPALRFVLPPLLRACDHVLLVDNGSDDGTGEEALPRRRRRTGCADRFTLKEYPFQVARAGAEHLAVNERSVHSLAYFYNWCFSHVRTRYSWKWDGDMVLTTEGEVSMADLSWQVGMAEAVIRFPRHGLYIESRPQGLPRPRPAQHRGVGLPDEPRLRLHQGAGVGDPYDARPDRAVRAAAGPLRRAQVARRRRVRPLDQPGVVRHLDPQPPQAPRVAGLERAPRRRGPRGRRRDRRARRACTWSTTSPTPGCPAPRAPSWSTTPTTPSCTCAPDRIEDVTYVRAAIAFTTSSVSA